MMIARVRYNAAARRLLSALALWALWALLAGAAQATDIRQWQREPIAVDLPVGTERIVVFNQPVRVGLPPAIAQAGVLRVQSTDGAVYFKAKKPFDTQRIQVQSLRTGEIILMNLTATQQASAETIRVEVKNKTAVMSRQQAKRQQRPQSRIPPAALGRAHTGAPTPVRLVRHAAQALYAPQRLVDGAPGIHRIAVTAATVLAGLLPAYPVEARPLAAWQAGAYTVTAIQITNRGHRAFALDPRGLAGNFYAASFMHRRLGPAGTLADTTTLFAVTQNGGLVEALAPTVGVLTEADNAD